MFHGTILTLNSDVDQDTSLLKNHLLVHKKDIKQI